MNKTKTDSKYFYGVGRRKRATARAKFYPGGKAISVLVNDKKLEDYFPDFYQKVLNEFFSLAGIKAGKFHLFINGGGIKGQAEAARLALAKSLVLQDEEYKPVLRMHGFMTTDNRKVLPKRPGRRKARKKEQWSKR